MTWLGEALAGFKVMAQLRKWYLSWRNPSVATRFVRLFESHGVHRNQIPRFIGHGLTLQDVQDDASLLKELDESLLEYTCRRFAVRREWLDGAERQIHPCRDFYKDPTGFFVFLEKLLTDNPGGRLIGVLIAPKAPSAEAQALIILQETIGAVGDKPIYRYHLLSNWAFAYWKARAYLTACIAIAWKRKVYIHGIKMSDEDIKQLAEGETLLGWQGEGIWKLGHKSWYPEDMALQPNAFLNGVDPEMNNFGIESALALWLYLDEQGFMDTGIDPKGARPLFQLELAECTSASSARNTHP